MTSKKAHYRKNYVANGASAKRLLAWVQSIEEVPPGDEVFYLAQSLSFLIHDSNASSLSVSMKKSHNRFAVRKLASALSLLDKVFTGKL